VAASVVTIVERILELLVLYVGLPAALLARVVPRVPIVVLVVSTAGCLALLLHDPTFDTVHLWNAQGALAFAPAVVVELGVFSALVVGAVAWGVPDHLFDLVRRAPRLWALVMVLYPLLSVYPQEVVYRAFFVHRYAVVLPDERARVVASAVLFAFGHVFFPRPWVAMSLTFLGGLLFAYHYEQSRSLLLVSVEHAVFGQLIFTVGLGRYFYAGGAARGRAGLPG
jgi:membrane protease YdiL (CAAX protease family)